MKLLQVVIRFCGARSAGSRGGMLVPHDFRVTVPAPLGNVDQADTTMVAATQQQNPATTLAASMH